MDLSLRRWLQISLFNLLLVALLGVVMRYKIAYSLPIVNQKYLQHGHSHFAFAGWITQVLMSLMVAYLYENGNIKAYIKYRWVLYANLLTAYGMLIAFPIQGYGLFSIIFSTLSVFVSYFFAFLFWKDLNKLKGNHVAHAWFKASLIFSVLSSFGAFSLAFMLATRSIQSEKYLASIYFFLHFQYNGWFLFACMGLLAYQLNKIGIPNEKLKTVYRFFVVACIPAYLLSTLWLPIPKWLYAIVILSVLMQLAGWFFLLFIIKKYIGKRSVGISTLSRCLLFLSALAFTIKLLLQAGSVIPSLSQLAFGFRPIVIGYLHLVLLGVITLFILSYVFALKLITVNKIAVAGVIIFAIGVIVNEILLMVQGIGDLYYVPIPLIDSMLFIAAIILFTGMLILNIGQKISNYASAHKR